MVKKMPNTVIPTAGVCDYWEGTYRCISLYQYAVINFIKMSKIMLSIRVEVSKLVLSDLPDCLQVRSVCTLIRNVTR